MPPKGKDKSEKTPKSSPDLKKSLKGTSKASTLGKSSILAESSTFEPPRNVTVSLYLDGEPEIPGEFNFLVLFDGRILLERKWEPDLTLLIEELPLNLNEAYAVALIADTPLIFVLRAISGGKGTKETDPLMHPDNVGGGNVDLWAFALRQEEVTVKVRLHLIATGAEFGCKVSVNAISVGTLPTDRTESPLLLTFISAHCLPTVKEGTVYVGAVSMDGLVDPGAVNFGMSLSSATAKKIVWATASTGGLLGETAYNVPNEDKFMPEDVVAENKSECNVVYWNAIKRILVDPTLLKTRLASKFLVEIAGVPRIGKVDVRGRYMGYIDAGPLLQPGQIGVTTCAALKYFSDVMLPENVRPVLELPATSGKTSARDKDRGDEYLVDDYGHSAYVVVRLDLMEPLVPKVKLTEHFEIMGFTPPEILTGTLDELRIEHQPDDNRIDVRRIREEGGALAVHKELSTLACRGMVPMNQSIKRSAANRLLVRVRTMLKQFAPGTCPYLDWQDAVTGQHAAARRAVTASFAPLPPVPRAGARVAAARARMAGDMRIADKHYDKNFKVAGNHPRVLLSRALRCLEARNDREAKNCLLRALSCQQRNRYLLWTFGGQEFGKGEDRMEVAKAALRISVRGEHADGTANAVGWAALHALYHYEHDEYGAFIAAGRMRKSYELQRDWGKLLERFTDASGEEEMYWTPAAVSSSSPLVIAAAFFLCLRCYDLSERILKCYEQGCGVRGSRFNLVDNICPDVYYIRAASWLLKRQPKTALELTEEAVRLFGPSAMLSQMLVTCLTCIRGWDRDCEVAFTEADEAGAQDCPLVLLKAAVAGIFKKPMVALQRAARAHKIAPGAHSALTIGRIYDVLGQHEIAIRWAACAVKFEPLLADGWAFLALMAMKDRNVNRARTMLRTARQAGPVSAEIEAQLAELKKVVDIEFLPEAITEKLCFCDYYSE